MTHWLMPALYLSWFTFLAAALVLSSACFAYIFLPASAHFVSFWEFLAAGALVRLMMVAMGTLHHRLAKQYGERFSSLYQPERALFHLRWALRWLPGDLRLYTLWCQILFREKQYEQIESVIQQMQYVHPGSDEIETQRAYLALQRWDWPTACRLFDRAYRLRRGVAWNDIPERIPVDQPEIQAQGRIETTLVKLQHDAAQLAFLRQGDYLPPAFSHLESAYQQILKALASEVPTASDSKDRFIRLSAAQSESIALFYGRNVHISPVPAFPRKTLDPDWNAAEKQAAYLEKDPACIVIDQFLQPDTAEALLHFCQKSTIWHDDTRPGGYLGAYMDDGFNCELLYQIADELRERMPQVFGDLVLQHMWAYTYASRKNGIGIHGDNAAVNVNFWITPDDANLEPGTGGMKVYNVRAPEHWSFETYNQDTAQIEAYLSEQQAQAETIAYAHNRAVIFDGRLFHETDHFHFADAYLKKRINITLLFDRP